MPVQHHAVARQAEVTPRAVEDHHGTGAGRAVGVVQDDRDTGQKLDALRVNLRKHKGRNLAKGKISLSAKRPEAYMAGGAV